MSGKKKEPRKCKVNGRIQYLTGLDISILQQSGCNVKIYKIKK